MDEAAPPPWAVALFSRLEHPPNLPYSSACSHAFIRVLVRDDLLAPSPARYGAPVFLRPKGHDKLRFLVDLRDENALRAYTTPLQPAELGHTTFLPGSCSALIYHVGLTQLLLVYLTTHQCRRGLHYLLR